MKFKELLKILERHYGTKRLADIAKELDVSPQVVNNWKARDQVPYHIISKIKNKITTEAPEQKINYAQAIETKNLASACIFFTFSPSTEDPLSITW